MRFLVEVKIPSENENKELMNWRLLRQLKRNLTDIKPEVVYFTLHKGRKTLYMVFDAPNFDKLPDIAEPLWLDFKADVNILPVVNVEEFDKTSIQRMIRARE